MLGTVHIIFAIAALILGAIVAFRPKGGQRHRTVGYFYAFSLLTVNLCALLVYEDSVGAGPFHVLAVISLMTLVGGFIPAFLRRPTSWWLELHAYFMCWSYVGLVAAGVAQITTMLSSLPVSFAAGLPSLVVVLIGAILIHTRVPQLLLALGSDRGSPGRRISG